MNPVNLEELREQFRGTCFSQLVQHYLNRQSQDQRIDGIRATIETLPERARPLAEEFIDRWNVRAYDEQFWQKDTALVFGEIIEDARSVLSPLGLSADDEAVFNMFNIVVLNYAYSAYDQPKMRSFMGLAARIPWPSAVALLYPISATIYIAGWTPAGPAVVAGYGLANLGYLLLAAGIWAGSFHVLGLKKRWQVFTAALAFFLVGTMLSNIGK
ncbi:MAG: hypothetical protein A3H49_07970 [Nitrospirae bacterium RIFCSPLOWO2_02_FULL_62_14]|nr:MAG: hypothetical protein A3H49_07970 [Nitrospirae bacterium RIFCSPLOWO2_02_FULL_62_14]